MNHLGRSVVSARPNLASPSVDAGGIRRARLRRLRDLEARLVGRGVLRPGTTLTSVPAGVGEVLAGAVRGGSPVPARPAIF